MADLLEIRPVVIAPTFNNARTLGQVLSGIDALALPAIVIDDGCTDETAAILQAWQSLPYHTVLRHEKNLGKAAALRSGFARASELGFTHAVTIDTDGQLNPGEIPNLLHVAERWPGAIVVGCRDARAPDYPIASLLGRRATNMLIRWESGARVSDSQCGFRVYPLKEIRSLHCNTERFNFETEILIRAAWHGVSIKQCDVRCVYQLPTGRVSHFRPWIDSLAGVKMHLGLLATALMSLRVPCSIPRRLMRWITPAVALEVTTSAQDSGELSPSKI